MQALDVFWVGMGGGAGSLLRWWIGRLVGEKYSGNFPLATFLINISGAFVIGFLSISFGVEWHDRFGD
ncbi:fluoride efflux transporter FluC, partial [Brucella sp. C7-11G]